MDFAHSHFTGGTLDKVEGFLKAKTSSALTLNLYIGDTGLMNMLMTFLCCGLAWGIEVASLACTPVVAKSHRLVVSQEPSSNEPQMLLECF